jgi:hypothetical protein
VFVTLRVAACTQRPFAKLSSVKTGTEAVLSRPLTGYIFSVLRLLLLLAVPRIDLLPLAPGFDPSEIRTSETSEHK